MAWLARRLRVGLRRRPGSWALVAVLAALVAVVAASTPLLLVSVQQAALEHALSGVPDTQREVLATASSDQQVTPLQARQRAAALTAALGRSAVWSAARTYREQNDDPLKWKSPMLAGGQPKQRIADVPSCAELRFTAGRCPTAADEAAVGDTTAARSGVTLGARVRLASTERQVTVRIVGVYDTSAADGRLAAHPSLLTDSPTTGLDPDLLVDPDTFDGLRLPTTAYSVRALDTAVPLAALPGIRAGLARAAAGALTAASAAASASVISTLPALLDRIGEQRAVVTVVLDVVAAGAVALALIALGMVVQRVARVRAAEWALPRLRGMPGRRRRGARLVEPGSALLVGTAIGAAAAIGIARAVVDPTTRRSIADGIPAAVVLAAVALVCGAATLAAVSAAATRRPLSEQLHRSTEPRELSRGALVAQAAVGVGGIAAIAALVTGTGVAGAGALAPVLVALAAGFACLRIAVLLARRRTASVPSSLTGLIVWRRLGRSPSAQTAVVLVAAAAALGTFVVATSLTADALATATAQATTAAETVLHVRVPADTSLLDAVDRADPGGTRALAAEELRAGVGVARVVAVDTARLGAVSTWRSAWAGVAPGVLARRLAPPVGPSLRLSGARLTITVDDLAPGPVDEGDESFVLQAVLQSPNGLVTVPLGTFGLDGASHTFSAAIPCADGCTLVSLGVRCDDQYPSPWSLRLTWTRLSTDVEPAAVFEPALSRSGDWTTEIGHVLDATLPTTADARAGPRGLVVDLADTIGTSTPSIRVRDTVEPLPAVFGPTTSGDRFPGAAGTTLGIGTDGSAILLDPVARSSALPRLLGDGVLVDLRRMQPQIDASSTAPDRQVWVRGDAGGIERRLRAEGVAIIGTDRLVRSESAERSEAGPLSARLALIGAAGALAVVLTALVGARLLAAASRRRQWRSFAEAGIPVRVMRRLVAIEFLVPAAVAVALGTACGAATFLLAVPQLPLADPAPLGPPAGVLPPWPVVAVVPAIALAVLALATPVVARAEVPEDRS